MKNKLRDLQLTELLILKEIKRICIKNNIRYFLSGGTLLGAVRHQGFIPWDDDIDIMMPYHDYLEFLKIAPKELDEKFFLQNYMTDLHDHQGFTKVRMNETAMILPNHKKWKIHQGIWVDIFPMISVEDYSDLKKRKMVLSVSNFIQMDTFVLDNENEFKKMLGPIYYVFRTFLLLPIQSRVKLHTFLLKYAYRECNGRYFSEAWGTMTNIYSVDLINGTAISLQFEDDSFSVLPGYEEYLKETYGNYMQFPPVEERKGHGDLIVDLHISYENILHRNC